MGIESYSTTPASNNSTPPNGAPEGMAPSKVNDIIRQVMADIRTQWETPEWFNWGDTLTYASATSFTISGDVTARYPVSRRVWITGATTGNVYGIITASSYSAPNTTITISADGSLKNETLTGYVASLTPTNPSYNSIYSVANVKDFGAVGDLVTNDTAAIQAAIDSFPTGGTFWGGIVYLPPGRYLIDGLTLRSRVSLVGSGRRVTSLEASATSNANFITMDSGVVEEISFTDLTLSGNSGFSGQICFYINAVAVAGQGGLWYSNFKRLRISGFTSHAIWLRGTHDGTNTTPIQFNTFEDLFVSKADTNVATRALLITGQVDQTTFKNCELDGLFGSGGGASDGTCNVEISREFSNAGVIGGSLVGGSLVGAGSAGAIKFINCTSQVSDMGFHLENANSITFDTCWFEGLRRGITVTNVSVSHILGCEFSNVISSIADGSGYYVKADNAHAYITSCNQEGPYEKAFISANDAYIKTDGNYFFAPPDAATQGIVSTNTVTSRKVNTNRSHQCNVEGTNDYIHSLTSNVSAGETVTITVTDSTSADKYIRLADIAGIQLPDGGKAHPGSKEIVLRKGDVATFLRTDDPIQTGRTWQLIGLVKATLQSNVMPTAGYFQVGEFVYNTSITAVGTGVAYLLGWTRITTGTNNVLGTDWLECNVTA